MFLGIIPETFSISSNKITYLIPEVVGPFLSTLNIEEVKKISSPFTIHYDEANNKQVKKRHDIKTMFWSETESAVKVHHLKAYVMGHVTGVLLAGNIFSWR